MDIKDLVKSPYTLRKFFISLVLGFILLLLIKYFVLPPNPQEYYYQFAINLTDNFITVLGSTIATALFLLFITPKVMHESDVNIINPHDLKSTLNDITNKTSSFTYYGHTARWNRAETLPKLLKAATNDKTRKVINIIILDPNHNNALSYYASFGHASRNRGKQIQTEKDVKKELFTTILSMYEYNKDAFLEINLYLSSTVSLFRMDVTDTALILTKPYSNEPAMLFNKDSFFYKSYNEEIKIIMDQSIKIDLNSIEKLDIYKNDNGRVVLNQLGFDTGELDQKDFKEIIKNTKNPKSPY